MRRNRKDNAKRERIIMIASSAFVLTALTMTGVYMQSRDKKSENDGYTIDFSALENKGQEIADNHFGDSILENDNILDGLTDDLRNPENDLDYEPMEAGSNLVEIPGLTDDRNGADNSNKNTETEETEGPSEEQSAARGDEPSNSPAGSTEPSETSSNEQPAGYGQDAMGENVVVIRELHFSENDGLMKPLAGELNVIIPFSMDSDVYFQTLDCYKKSDAMVISAPEGASVIACAEGKVIKIFQNEEFGHAVLMELGDGYQITYGQLRDIQVAVGSYVNAGEAFASVAKTAKYYYLEGSNLYLKLTANGTEIDPSPLFR